VIPKKLWNDDLISTSTRTGKEFVVSGPHGDTG